jgi:hypothetical protein
VRKKLRHRHFDILSFLPNHMRISEGRSAKGLRGSDEKVEAPTMERDCPFTTDKTRDKSPRLAPLLPPAIDNFLSCPIDDATPTKINFPR